MQSMAELGAVGGDVAARQVGLDGFGVAVERVAVATSAAGATDGVSFAVGRAVALQAADLYGFRLTMTSGGAQCLLPSGPQVGSPERLNRRPIRCQWPLGTRE